jgi:Zn ribbon nucleic-acid-binding protein
MTDSIFGLRCVDCDAQGLLSQLWLRASVEINAGRSSRTHHYVECMNCGVHMKSRHRNRMELVDDDEWNRFVDRESAVGLMANGTARVN